MGQRNNTYFEQEKNESSSCFCFPARLYIWIASIQNSVMKSVVNSHRSVESSLAYGWKRLADVILKYCTNISMFISGLMSIWQHTCTFINACRTISTQMKKKKFILLSLIYTGPHCYSRMWKKACCSRATYCGYNTEHRWTSWKGWF